MTTPHEDLDRSSITMLLDVTPNTLDPRALTDYVAQFVASAIYPPLIDTTGSASSPLALARIVALDARRGRLHLRLDERRWSDGRAFDVSDVLETWGLIEQEGGAGRPLQRLLLGDSSVRESCSRVSDKHLTVQLRPGGAAFLNALASPSLTPFDPEMPGYVSLGPYRLDSGAPTAPSMSADDRSPWASTGIEVNSAGFDLTRNPHAPTFDGPVDHIRLAIERDPHRGLAQWRDGKCDATCNTMFPTNFVSDPAVAPYLLRTRTPLRGVVRLDPAWVAGTGVDPALLSAAVPRGAIAEMLHGCVSAESRYWSGDPIARTPVPGESARERAAGRSEMRLAVADFYPNLKVCRRLVRAWRGLGVEVDLNIVEYADLASCRTTHNATYEIWGLPYPDLTSGLLTVDLTALGADTDVLRARQNLVGAVHTATGDAKTLSAHLHRHVPHIPILGVHSIMAVNPRLRGLTVDELGRPRFDSLTVASGQRCAPRRGGA